MKSRYDFSGDIQISIRASDTPSRSEYLSLSLTCCDTKYASSSTTFGAPKMMLLLVCMYLNYYAIGRKTSLCAKAYLVQTSKVPFFARISDARYTLMIFRLGSSWAAGLGSKGFCVLYFLFTLPRVIPVFLKAHQIGKWRFDLGSFRRRIL